MTSVIHITIIALTLLQPAQGYNDDANQDWAVPVRSAVPGDEDDTSLVRFVSDDADPRHLSEAEFGTWLAYTIITLIAFVACALRARHVVMYVLRRGFRGLRGVELEVRLHYEDSTTTIGLFGHRQATTVSCETTIANRGEATLEVLPSVDEPAPQPDSEQFHDCTEG